MAKKETLSTEEGTAAVQQPTAEKEAVPSGGEILYGKQPTQAAADDMQDAAAQPDAGSQAGNSSIKSMQS